MNENLCRNVSWPRRRGARCLAAALAVWVIGAGAVLAFDGFVKMKDGYFYDSVNGEPFVPHGIAYQTWNRPLGVWQTKEQIDYDLDEMVKMGANSIRVDFVWQHIEEDGDNQWKWENYDYLVQAAEERNLRMFALIGYQWPPNWFPEAWYTMHPPEFDSSGIYHPTRWPSDIINYEHPQARAQYAEWFQNVCSRYKDSKAIVGWIIGNESGYLGLWSGLLDGYDPESEAAFRSWCQTTYVQLTNLNAHWGTAITNFADITFVEQFREYGVEGSIWADMVQWREDSIGSFTALGAVAAKAADTNHLISYSTVGMQWGEEDWRYHAEDRGKITRACRAAGAPIDFFSVNNYPWSILGHESQNGQWGISYTKKVTASPSEPKGVPVLYSETGFTSSESMWPGMDEFRQGPLIRNSLWESLEAGAVGTHIFAWHDRPYITDREKGFGILYSDRNVKPAFWVSRDTFMLMEQAKIASLLAGSSDPKPDIAFLWTAANDSQYNRYECEMQQIAGALERVGYEPNFVFLDDLASGAYTNFKVLCLPRNMRVDTEVPGTGKGVLRFLRENVLPKGIHLLASADLPGMQDENGRPCADFTNELAAIFGIDGGDVGGFEVAPRTGNYISSNMVTIKVSFSNAVGPLTNGYACTPRVWKYNDEVRVTDGSVWATMDTLRNKGFEDVHTNYLPGWYSWGSPVVTNWFPMDGSNMVWLAAAAGLWQDFPASPFGRYTASTWLRSNPDDPLRGGAAARILIEWRDKFGAVLGSSDSASLNRDTASQWVQYKVDTLAPSNAILGRRVIRYDNTTNYPNLVVNGELSGSGDAPTGWSSWNNGSHDADSGTFRSGANSWRFWWDGGLWQNVASGFKPGDSVTFGGYLYAPSWGALGGGKRGTIELEFYNSGNTQLSVVTAAPPADALSAQDAWFLSQGTVTVPSGADHAHVVVRCTAGDGQFFVDDVFFYGTTPGGSVFVDNLQRAPALVVKNHGTAKAAIFLFSAGDISPDGNDDGQMDVLPWLWRYDYVGAVVRDYFGVQPPLEVLGANAYLCLAEYRTCTNGATLWQVKNYEYDLAHTNHVGGEPQTFTIRSPLFSNKTVRAFEQGRILATNSSGTVQVTLVPDGQEILLAYPPPASNSLVCQIADAPSVIHPFGDKNYALKIKYDTLGQTNLTLYVALYGGKYSNQVYQMIATNVSGAGEQTFWMWIPDFNQTDTNYASTPDGGQYQWTTWLADPASNVVADAVSQTTELKWGTRPTANLPTTFTKGSTTNLPVEWEELYEYLYWQHCPMARNDAFPTRVGIYRSTKTEAQFPGHLARVNQVCDWLDSMGYTNGDTLDVSFDDVAVLKSFETGGESGAAYAFTDNLETGAPGWTAEGLWHLATDQSSSPTHSWAYNNGTSYDTGARNFGALITPWIELTNATSATLTFKSWYETEDAATSWDQKKVYVSTDGTNWTQVLQVSGTSGQWLPQTCDLAAYAGRRVRIKFFFDTVDAVYNQFKGWYLDDVAVASVSGAPVDVFYDDMESTTNWTAEALWRLATNRTSGGLTSWVYNNGTDYNTGARTSGGLISRWIDLTDVSSAALSFKSWYRTEDTGTSWDRKVLYVTKDGTNWTQILQVSGLDQQWTTQQFDLSAYAGQCIRLRFFFDSTDALYNGFEGWYVDDVRITTVGGTGVAVFSDPAESGTNGWAAAGLWHQADDQFVSASHSWAYNNGTNYSTGARNSGALVSPWIDLSAAASASLSFKSWYETEDTGTSWDQKKVYVSTDGTNWTQVLQVSGANRQWNALTCDLSAYAGQRVRLKFFFDTVDAVYNQFKGWYLDNIVVRMIGSNILFFEPFSGAGLATNWARAAGAANWDVGGGELRSWRIGNDDNICAVQGVSWTNYAVQARIRYNRQGPYFDDAELYVRYVDRNNFVKVLIQNYYGFWRLKYIVRVATNNIEQGWVHNFTKTNRPVENTWYTLGVDVQDTNYSVYFDGAPVGSFALTNFPFTQSRVAIGARAVQLGIWEPQKGYYFIDDDEYSYWSATSQSGTSLGSPVDLDWGYLQTFFGTLILPGVYVMKDREASNVVTWLNKGTYNVIATDGGTAMKDETGADDPDRLAGLFGAAPSLRTITNLQRAVVGARDHYVTLDYAAGDLITANGGPAAAWDTPTNAVALGTLEGSANAPAFLCNLTGPDRNSPSKVFCFNFAVDTGGQLTNQFRNIARRAFEWTRGQAHKVLLELKYPNPSGNRDFDITVGSVSGWALGGTGLTNLVFNLPGDGIMTGDNLYWSLYIYPWDSDYPWGDHDGFYSSQNDGLSVSIPGKGLQVIGSVDPAYAGRAWGVWIAYNTRGEDAVIEYGLKDKGNLLLEDNFDDTNYNGWSVHPATNFQWSVTTAGVLRATSAPSGGYSILTRDGLDVSDTNLTFEYDVRFEDRATGGGIVYRGYPLYVNPDGIWWSGDDPLDFQSPSNFSGVITNADGSLVYVITGNISIYIGPPGLTTGVWHHISVCIRDAESNLMSDVYVDGTPQLLAVPLPGTNYTSPTVGFLSGYTNGHVEWDNVRVADEQYSFTWQTVNGEFVETNADVPLFWAYVPDYDPAMWEHEGTTLGGKYEWFAFFRGEDLHAAEDAHIYFAPRLMIEATNFPFTVNKGDTVAVPIDWENLPTNPVKMKLSLEYPYETPYQHATSIVTRLFDITETSGSAYFSITIPNDTPAGDGYLWAVSMYPPDVSDPVEGRVGLDDTFRFTTNGPIVWNPREVTITVTSVSSGGTLRVFSDAGIPVGSDIQVWGADYFIPITSPTAYDGGFETSTGDGTFPNSGWWHPATPGPDSDALCTVTATRSDTNGLWEYTGWDDWQNWCAPYQEFHATEGDVFRCQAYVRQPAGADWVSGSRAFVRMKYINAASNEIAHVDSAVMVTNAGQDWTLSTVNNAGAAPSGTKYMRYELFMDKPLVSGVSVANFDDCTVSVGNSFYGNYEGEGTNTPEGYKCFRSYIISWSGWGVFYKTNELPQGVDLSGYATGDLKFWLKTPGGWCVEVQDVYGNKGRYPSFGWLSPTPTNEAGERIWQEKTIPISYFSGAGVDLEHVWCPFAATDPITNAVFSFYVDDVRWVPAP